MKKTIAYFFLFIYSFICIISIEPSFAQIAIKGKVVDKITKEPIELAVIRDEKKKNTLSDKEGNFILKNTIPADTLVISFIGYKIQKVAAADFKQNFYIELERGSIDLSEVILTAHSNSISTSRSFSSIDLNMKPARSAQDLLRLVPGLFIAQQVGGGKAEQIFLRGFDADHGTDVNVSKSIGLAFLFF
ncbi:MAG: TonB-dependent receptor [Bacteroidota bacterium]|nr:TonB-dependent receptor [Bacteroidota bacterium]